MRMPTSNIVRLVFGYIGLRFGRASEALLFPFLLFLLSEALPLPFLLLELSYKSSLSLTKSSSDPDSTSILRGCIVNWGVTLGVVCQGELTG